MSFRRRAAPDRCPGFGRALLREVLSQADATRRSRRTSGPRARTIEVPVTREEVVIERRPAAQGQKADGDIAEGEAIRIPLMEEEVRVEKTPVVREEVTLKERQIQDTERVSETVRREEARIEETQSEPWRGNERRYRHDSNYRGPERRAAGV